MTPTNPILDQLLKLIAADPTTLAPTLFLKVHLAAASFTPSPILVPADFTEATFPGYAAIANTVAPWIFYTDPSQNGARVIECPEPLDGWLFKCTGAPTAAQTIYGYYVTDSGGTNLYGSNLFATPLTVGAAGDAVEVPKVAFTLVASPLF